MKRVGSVVLATLLAVATTACGDGEIGDAAAVAGGAGGEGQGPAAEAADPSVEALRSQLQPGEPATTTTL